MKTLIILLAAMFSMLYAMPDPPSLPSAPNQGPIGGMVWLAIAGGIMAVKKHLKK
jgi:hypothetical protein|tara:strand:- start:619 stop:783 length:165 start_codon:yes stop_codon:yes gene_type:complete